MILEYCEKAIERAEYKKLEEPEKKEWDRV
jgi:hypothetical protein